jgi:hypothetical protein
MSEEESSGNPLKKLKTTREGFLKASAVGGLAALSGLFTIKLIKDASDVTSIPDNPKENTIRTPQEVSDLFDEILDELSKDENVTKFKDDSTTSLGFEIGDYDYIFTKRIENDQTNRKLHSYDRSTRTNFYVNLYPDHIDKSVSRYTEQPPEFSKPEANLTTMNPREVTQFYEDLKIIAQKQQPSSPPPYIPPAKST